MLLTLALLAAAQKKGSFVVFNDKMASVEVDSSDWKGVQRAAQQLREDILRVAGKSLSTDTKRRIVVGTIGKSKFIDALAADGRLDVSSIRGQWESFVIEPLNDGSLVVAGSDKRGTIYGIYEISRRIGVSP